MNPVRDPVLQRLCTHGPATSAELATALGVSTSTVSRALRGSPDVLTLGRARRTRHGLRRSIDGVGSSAVIFEVTDHPRRLGTLHAVAPDRFAFEPVEGNAIWTDDLPWFLFDLRPAGYLGRQIPQLHPELRVPPDIHRWTSDDVLRYLVSRGHDPVGALVVGEAALLGIRPPEVIDASRFPVLAEHALAAGPVGSSAAGEQPKFLTTTVHGPVLVKFSPPRVSALAVRIGDLLIAEHLALLTLREAGRSAATSHLHLEERVFLEVERFDRTAHGRRGQVMLTGLDAEFVGEGTGWVGVMEELHRQKRVSSESVREVAWREQFGIWIANTDRHLGNQALWMEGLTLGGPTPVYDMLPMAYAPVGQEVVPRTFAPAIHQVDARLLAEVHPVAVAFWQRVAADERVSPDFRAIATANGQLLGALGERIAWLCGAGRSA